MDNEYPKISHCRYCRKVLRTDYLRTVLEKGNPYDESGDKIYVCDECFDKIKNDESRVKIYLE
ncbi:MAG: hypothetical protein ACOC80_16420 [Petrotogales bacterium]